MKAIIHFSDVQQWQRIQRNIMHMMDAEPNVVLEVVIMGDAVTLLQEASELALIQILAQRGVRIAVCQHSLETYELERLVLPDTMTIVPVGMLELVHKQQEGYTYLKP